MAAEVVDAKTLALAIRRVAEWARSEEDLRIGVEEALEPVRKLFGVSPRYERSYPGSVSILGGGSSDAVYGHAIIEYKKPGRLSRKRDLGGAVGELEKYLADHDNHSTIGATYRISRKTYCHKALATLLGLMRRGG